MFKPTIELHEYDGEGNVNIILRKEVDIDQKSFPEVVVWKDETFTLEDFTPMTHAVYVKTPHIKIAYEPVIA